MTGRAGELLRTGTATNWDSLKVADIAISVSNARADPPGPQDFPTADRLIPVQVLERLSPDSIRVASEMKPLKVRVQFSLADPTARDAKRPALQDAINKFFQDIAGNPDRFFTKSDLSDKLRPGDSGARSLRPATGGLRFPGRNPAG